MNRRRHYFYRVDSKVTGPRRPRSQADVCSWPQGRLLRLEIDRPGEHFGEIRANGPDWRLVDYFFSVCSS